MALGEAIFRNHPHRIWKKARKVLGFLTGRKRPSPEGKHLKGGWGLMDAVVVYDCVLAESTMAFRNSSQRSSEGLY